uniref:Transmembrane protein n=1 Tax=Panagrellus redivivus TaxID=6233 RepID=A0A7E4VVE9_PANRE
MPSRPHLKNQSSTFYNIARLTTMSFYYNANMNESKKLPILINKNDIQVTTDCFCTQLTYRIKPGDVSNNSCQYEIHCKCTGSKVVNVTCGPDTYKCHDGCLQKISKKLGKIAEHNDEITIESRFDPVIVKKAFTYIFNLDKFQIDQLSIKEKYEMVLFGAHYDFPVYCIQNLIDRSVYADLVQYAWTGYGDNYLMNMLPKMRIPNIDFLEDFKKVDEKIMLKFVRKYLEHKINEKKFNRNMTIGFIAFVCVLLFSFIAWCCYNSRKNSYPHHAYYANY